MRPPWWYWLQLRDIIPVLISALVLCAFLYACTAAGARVVTDLLASFDHHWNHP